MLHACQSDSTFHWQERRLADVQVAPHHAVHIGTGRREHHACCETLGAFPFAAHHHAVGEHVGVEAVRLLRRRGVRDRRVYLDDPDQIEQAQVCQRHLCRGGKQIGALGCRGAG